jgi:hypothetical protein
MHLLCKIWSPILDEKVSKTNPKALAFMMEGKSCTCVALVTQGTRYYCKKMRARTDLSHKSDFEGMAKALA